MVRWFCRRRRIVYYVVGQRFTTTQFKIKKTSLFLFGSEEPFCAVHDKEKTFLKNKFKFNIYANIENISSIKDDIFEKSINNNDKPIDLFITLDQKLINFDFNKYTIKSYKKLEELSNSKILDYSLEIS